jgi:hypothetical protein
MKRIHANGFLQSSKFCDLAKNCPPKNDDMICIDDGVSQILLKSCQCELHIILKLISPTS